MISRTRDNSPLLTDSKLNISSSCKSAIASVSGSFSSVASRGFLDSGSGLDEPERLLPLHSVGTGSCSE